MTTIAEEVLLLALSEREGAQLVGSTDLDIALGGALLAELAAGGRVSLDDKKVTVLDPTPLGDEEADAALARIAAENRSHKPDGWVYKLRSGKLRERLLTRLAERGVLDEERSKILGIFPRTRHPERDPSAERAVRDRVLSVLDGAAPDERTAALIAVLHAAKIDRKAFPDVDRRRFKEIARDHWVGDAVSKTIDSVNIAVMTATTTTTVT
ncbi:GPP34 family phosphoprotein [Streptosporangium sp. NPDC048047]|uniref:GOLPH3/VPS74 family protein n=1 Tax=Streptosporangium sp. NPDC048047 TaxID=3155748 RepID=UPI00344934A0